MPVLTLPVWLWLVLWRCAILVALSWYLLLSFPFTFFFFSWVPLTIWHSRPWKAQPYHHFWWTTKCRTIQTQGLERTEHFEHVFLQRTLHGSEFEAFPQNAAEASLLSICRTSNILQVLWHSDYRLPCIPNVWYAKTWSVCHCIELNLYFSKKKCTWKE